MPIYTPRTPRSVRLQVFDKNTNERIDYVRYADTDTGTVEFYELDEETGRVAIQNGDLVYKSETREIYVKDQITGEINPLRD